MTELTTHTKLALAWNMAFLHVRPQHKSEASRAGRDRTEHELGKSTPAAFAVTCPALPPLRPASLARAA